MGAMKLERWVEKVALGAPESIRRVFVYLDEGIVAASDGYTAHWGRIPEGTTGLRFRAPVDVEVNPVTRRSLWSIITGQKTGEALGEMWIDPKLLRQALAGMPQGEPVCLRIYGRREGEQGGASRFLLVAADNGERAALIGGIDGNHSVEPDIPGGWNEESETEAE